MNVSNPTPLTRVASLVLLSAAPLAVQAQSDNLPLFLTFSHSIQRDSNFARTTDAVSETVNATGVAAGLNKAYGRQNYTLYGRLTANRYDRFGDQLNNDGKDVNAAFSTGIASNWQVSLTGQYNENLNSIQDNLASARLVRNIRKYRDGKLTVQYGNGGRWSLVGTADTNRLSYTEIPTQNANQRSTGLRLVYNHTDLLNFGVGPRWVTTEYPKRTDESTIKDRNLDFTTNWQVTGVSKLNALLSLRNSKASGVSGRSTDAFTGSLGWVYTPRGLVTYAVNLSRSTDSDRLQETQAFRVGSGTVNTLRNVASDNVTNTLFMSAQYQATAKVAVGATYELNRYEASRLRDPAALGSTGLVLAGSSTDSNSRRQAVGLSVQYAPIRAVAVSCSLQRYSQTPDNVGRIEFEGHSTGCSASFTLD